MRRPCIVGMEILSNGKALQVKRATALFCIGLVLLFPLALLI